MKVTVILCTYNRCKHLPTALESVAVSTLSPSVDWEVLVVDNKSTDQTREVIEDFCRRYPGRFRYLFEPQAGKSNALNAGIREARADVLAFLDDDVTVEPAWLQNLTAGLENGQWAGAAGRIFLEWPSSLPSWVATEGPYSRCPFPSFDEGPEAKQITTPPFGTNMAFQRAMFEKYGSFRTDLGPSPNRDIPCPGEDTEFGRRLIDGGERLRYEPSAVVHHPVSPNRVDKRYFLNWWYDEGRASIRVFGVRRGTKWYVAGIPLYLLRSLVLWTLRWMTAVDPRPRFYYKVVVWGKVGGITECYRMWRDAKTLTERN